jgi:hypothetical protein
MKMESATVKWRRIAVQVMNAGVSPQERDEFEGEVVTNYGDEEQVLGDDEMTDSATTDREEAPCDGDVVMRGVVTSNVGSTSVNLRPIRCSRHQ